MVTTHMVYAIDPGDEHVGWASWNGTNGFRHAQTYEVADEGGAFPILQAIRVQLESTFHPPVQRTLVVERFSLYADKALSQSGSTMKTAQMIGALKYIARLTDTDVVEQGADIKKPTRKQLKARGIELVATGPGDHAKDAETHLLHYLLKEGLWNPQSS